MVVAVVVNIIYICTLLVVSVFGLVNFRKCNVLFRLLVMYVLYTLVSETISATVSYLWHNNSLVQKIYLFAEIVFMASIYYLLFRHYRQRRTILLLASLLFLFCLVYYIINQEALFPGYLVALESIMLIVFAVMYFFQLLKYPYEHDLLSMGEFWLNSSVLVYSTGSFVGWVSFSYVYRHHISLPSLPVIMNALDILHYTLLGAAIFFHVKRKSIIVHENADRQ